MKRERQYLDFAYLIHTAIGNTAIAAKVNMKLEPLSYQLKTGDQVEIITAENEKPKREWLQFLKTRKAKNIVIDYLKGERQESIKVGKKMLEEQLAAIGTKLNDKTIKNLLEGYEIFEDNADALFFRIGVGILKLNNLEEIIRKPEEKSKGWNFPWFKSKEKKSDKFVINDTSDQAHKYIIADCCNPIPGDSIVGFISSDNTVTVHKKTCSVANSIAAKHGDRIVMPQWEQDATTSFLVRLSLKGFDRIGIINEISRYISFVLSVNMRGIYLNTEDGVFDGYIDLYVHDKEDLDRLVRKLLKIEGIQSVVRTDL